jgi:pimeloyl-ACP methyl ester carboxylesterase
VDSTPHPLALRDALAGGDAAQTEQGTATEAFLDPEVPERLLLGSDGTGSGLAAMLAESGLDDEDARVYLITLTEPGALTAALNWYRAMDGTQLDGLEPVLVPTLYVWSTGDTAVGRNAAERSAAHVWGRYQFEVLKGVSHWIPETASADLSELLVRHLSFA